MCEFERLLKAPFAELPASVAQVFGGMKVEMNPAGGKVFHSDREGAD